MRIHRPGLLQAFWMQHPEAEASLKAWFYEARNASWVSLPELRARHPRSVVLQDGSVMFDLCDRKYALTVRIDFSARIILVRAIALRPAHARLPRRGLDA
jgi:mRNA interferase HigB